MGRNEIELTIETAAGVSETTKTVTYAPGFSTLDQRLLYVDAVDVDNDRPVLAGTIVIDLERTTVLGFLPGQHVRGVSPDVAEIYLHDRTVIGTDYHQVLRTLPFSSEIPANGFVVAPDGERLYSRNEIVEVATNEQLTDGLPMSIVTTESWASAPIPGDPAISADGNVIYCCNDVAKIDTETLELLARRGSSSAFETDLAISPRDGVVLVADYSFATGRLRAYDPVDLTALGLVSGLGDFVGEIAFSADGDRAVVSASGNPASPSDGGLSVVDLRTWNIVSQTQIPLADNLVTPGNNEFMVTSGESDLVRGIGVQILVLEPAGNLVRTKTYFLGVNRYLRSSGRPRNDRIRKLVFKPQFEPPCVPGATTACLLDGRFEVRTVAYDHGVPRQR